MAWSPLAPGGTPDGPPGGPDAPPLAPPTPPAPAAAGRSDAIELAQLQEAIDASLRSDRAGAVAPTASLPEPGPEPPTTPGPAALTPVQSSAPGPAQLPLPALGS
eukprot:15444950-Alexandrium_andersonii.AAC.1